MSRLASASIFVAIFLTLGATVTNAQGTITLAATGDGGITFMSDGSGNLTMTLGSCSVGPNCITGVGTGTGVFASGSGSYVLTLSGSVGLVNNGGGHWTVTSGGPLTFAWGSFLTGNLNLVNLSQSTSSGTFNTDFVANLTSLGGSLASFFTSAGGVANITIHLATGADLSTPNAKQTATLDHASIAQTPEPGSILLFGTGLLMLGVILRRWLPQELPQLR